MTSVKVISQLEAHPVAAGDMVVVKVHSLICNKCPGLCVCVVHSYESHTQTQCLSSVVVAVVTIKSFQLHGLKRPMCNIFCQNHI